MECENCHNSHTTTASAPLVDPHNPGPTGSWTTSRGDEKAFCFRCHNGDALPTSAETTPWAQPVLATGGATTVTDIRDAYSVNVHGEGVSASSTVATARLRPDMGYQVNTTLECSACHEPHGTVNSYALRQNVVSADGGVSINGVLVVTIPAGSTSPTSAEGYDLRYFCSTCHLFSPADHDLLATGSSTSTLTASFTDCTRCHRHVRTNGTPTSRL